MTRRLVLLAVLLAPFSSCAPSGPDAQTAAPLSGPDLAGKTISLADFKDKVVLVDFWATWCDPCQREIPDLVALQERLGPKGFTVLGVSMDEDRAAVGPFLRRLKVNYPVMALGEELPPKGWLVPGLPTAFLVGRDGMIKKRWFGAKSADDVTAAVEAALAR
jgi:thiol-disulfide isomerase/thioredoxin